MTDYVADARRAKLFSKFNAARALLALKDGRPLTGLEREVNDECEKVKLTENNNACWVPWEAMPRNRAVAMELTRADTVSPASSGGYLTATDLHPAIPALYHNSVTVPLGATVIPDCVGNYGQPTQPGPATAYWLNGESTQVTTSQQTFSQPAGTPKGVGAYTEFSRQLALQSSPTGVQDAVARDLFTLVGLAIDLAALTGNGLQGVPLGILNTSGITTFTGTSFALSTAMGALTDIGDALDGSTGWAADRASAISLRQRLEFSGAGSRAIWEDDVRVGTLAGLPARSTKALAANTLICGSWQYLHIPVWGPGLELSLNPYDTNNFKSGVIGCRVLAYVDTVAVYPGAFAATSTFT